MAKKPAPLFKLIVYDNGDFVAKHIGEPDTGGKTSKGINLDPDITKLAEKKVKKPKKGKHAVVFETNPTWVFIGGRWVRIG